MKTFAQWQDEEVSALRSKYPRLTEIAAREHCDERRWTERHILPAMQAGERPSHTVAKSIAARCTYSPLQLAKIWRGLYQQEGLFWPSGFDYEGRKVQ